MSNGYEELMPGSRRSEMSGVRGRDLHPGEALIERVALRIVREDLLPEFAATWADDPLADEWGTLVYVVLSALEADEIEPHLRIEALEAENDGLRKIIGRRDRTIRTAHSALSRVATALREAEIDRDWNAVASAAALAEAAANPNETNALNQHLSSEEDR